MTQWMLLRNGLLHCGSAHATTAAASSASAAAMASPALIATRNRRLPGVSAHWLRRYATIPDRHKRNHFKSNRDAKDTANAQSKGGEAGANKPKVGSWNLFDSTSRTAGTNANASRGGGGGAHTGNSTGANSRQAPKKTYGRRGGAAVDKRGGGGAVFTTKFQNLLSFAVDDDGQTEKKQEKKESSDGNKPRTSGLKGQKSPLGISMKNRKPAFGATKKHNALEDEMDDDDDSLDLTNDLAITALALDTDDDVSDDDIDATKLKKVKPAAEDAAKKRLLKQKTKKDGRSLLKNFKFENSIFGEDSGLFGHVDWEERGTVNREERRFKRQQRKTDKKKPRVVLPPQEVEIPTRILVKDLADRMGVKSKVLIRALRDLGEHVTDDSVITNDIAEIAVEELNMIPVLLPPEFVDVELTVPPTDCSMFPVRPSVISVMGHVDHGKTTLLDTLRKANVAASEAGGITQGIGAFSVNLGGKFGAMGEITFIDTPGHAAFSNMRSMGSEVTDIIVLVIAADDGVRPQTQEVIQLAQKNNVPLVVAVTKMDMHAHDQDEVAKRIAGELLNYGVVVESMGGDTPLVCVSGKTGEGLDTLKETIALHAEVLDLRADKAVGGEAVVLESKLARGVGPQVDTIVKWGTLKNGSVVVCGLEYGKIRALVGADGKRLKEATPGTPVRVIGLKGLPNSGDALLTVPSEERAKEVVQEREEMLQWDLLAATEEAEAEAKGEEVFPRRRRYMGGRAKSRELEFRRRQALDEATRLASLKVGDDGYVAKLVPIIIKTDSMGVISAIDDLIAALPTDEAVVKRVLGAVGPVSSSDLALAEATGATIYHFNVKHPAGIDQEALQKDVTLKAHNVIYSLLDDITDLLRDNLEGVHESVVIGTAEVVQEIPITKSGRRTVNIAGCRVTSGAMNMQAKYRLLRDGEVIADDLSMDTMRHFQDKVSEVTKGQECGLQLANHDTFKPGDVLEAYTVKIVKKGL